MNHSRLWISTSLVAIALVACGNDQPTDTPKDAAVQDSRTEPDANLAMDAMTVADGSVPDASVLDATPDCTGTRSSDPALEEVLGLFRAENARQLAPGGTFAIVRRGQPPVVAVVGSKRPDVCDPITDDTLFRIGLADGALTAIGVMHAVEHGEIDLEEPLKTYVPELMLSSTTAAGLLNVRHLLQSSSGLGAQDDPVCGTLDELTMSGQRVSWSLPGEIARFDPLQMSLAGIALTRVSSGVPSFREVMAARVLEPLGMTGTYLGSEAAGRDHSPGYRRVGNQVVSQQIDEVDCEIWHPSTGYFATARDMVPVMNLLLSEPNPVLSASSVQTMFDTTGPHFFQEWAVALGFTKLQTDDGSDLYYLDGYSAAHSQVLYVAPALGFAMFVATNSEMALYVFADEVLRVFFGHPWTSPTHTPTLEELQSLVGTYFDPIGLPVSGPRTMVVTVSADSTTLEADVTIAGRTAHLTLTPDGGRDIFRLTLGNSSEALRFWRDDMGRGKSISGLLLSSGPPLFRSN